MHWINEFDHIYNLRQYSNIIFVSLYIKVILGLSTFFWFYPTTDQQATPHIPNKARTVGSLTPISPHLGFPPNYFTSHVQDFSEYLNCGCTSLSTFSTSIHILLKACFALYTVGLHTTVRCIWIWQSCNTQFYHYLNTAAFHVGGIVYFLLQ